MTTATFDIVIPTIGRPSLEPLLRALAPGVGPPPGCIYVVDDRGHGEVPLDEAQLGTLVDAPLRVLRSGRLGPAAARNSGWRASCADWVVFLDDDVVPDKEWLAWLAKDLAAAEPSVGGVQGIVRVATPQGRAPTDWERQVGGLATACWITADMAYRRAALEEVGGFDAAFSTAYREDSDLALRVQDAGWELVCGQRLVHHPVGPSNWFVSVRRQRGNADDYLMRSKHGPSWQRRAHVTPGRRRRHALVCAAGVGAVAARMTGHGRAANVMALGWACGTAELAWARIAPGPRNSREILTMATTSIALPFAAIGSWLYGMVRSQMLPRTRRR